MAAEYLLRFDDICPTMSWRNWDHIEAILVQQQIRPILAVVPDNQDPELNISRPDPTFWERVRGWQRRGWTIGMHGWQHRFVTNNAGIVGVTPRSEFAGLPRKVQQSKISAADAIFNREGIRSRLWIAPAHSFDESMLEVLKEIGVQYISDGFAIWPFSDSLGMMWIPQQLWSFRYRPFGTWTICFHVNRWTNADVAAFEFSVQKCRGLITSFPEIVAKYRERRKTVWDSFAASAYRCGSAAKNSISTKTPYAVRNTAAGFLDS